MIKNKNIISVKTNILCSFCNKGYLYKRKVLITRTGNRKKNPSIQYLCSFCGKSFNQKQIEM